MATKPIIKVHDGISVVRDDLFAGGTKARFIPELFADCDELVYASPQEGGAQTAIASVAKALGKKATIFVAKRSEPNLRPQMAKALGAKIYQVSPGYLSVVQARAREYAEATGAKLAPFGLHVPWAPDRIADAARLLKISPDEVWCAAGSGTLARGLMLAWPRAAFNLVRVGRDLPADLIGGNITVHEALLPFEKAHKVSPPFPADPHYEAKAWEICVRTNRRDGSLVLFWNVTGPATLAVQ